MSFCGLWLLSLALRRELPFLQLFEEKISFFFWRSFMMYFFMVWSRFTVKNLGKLYFLYILLKVKLFVCTCESFIIFRKWLTISLWIFEYLCSVFSPHFSPVLQFVFFVDSLLSNWCPVVMCPFITTH